MDTATEALVMVVMDMGFMVVLVVIGVVTMDTRVVTKAVITVILEVATDIQVRKITKLSIVNWLKITFDNFSIFCFFLGKEYSSGSHKKAYGHEYGYEKGYEHDKKHSAGGSHGGAKHVVHYKHWWRHNLAFNPSRTFSTTALTGALVYQLPIEMVFGTKK